VANNWNRRVYCLPFVRLGAAYMGRVSSNTACWPGASSGATEQLAGRATAPPPSVRAPRGLAILPLASQLVYAWNAAPEIHGLTTGFADACKKR